MSKEELIEALRQESNPEILRGVELMLSKEPIPGLPIYDPATIDAYIDEAEEDIKKNGTISFEEVKKKYLG